MNEIVKIQNLTKNYTEGKGVFGINLSIEKGEALGIVGPCGCGKTTIIRALLGFIFPDKGVCEINGFNSKKNYDLIMQIIGYMPDNANMFESMTGVEFLKFIARMRNLNDFYYCNELVTKFEFNIINKVKDMTKEDKEKLAIITTFMHDPLLIILDRTISQFEQWTQNKLIELILNEKLRGKTIIMTSSKLEDVDKICDKIAFLKSGLLVGCDEISTVRGMQKKIYLITFNTVESAQKFLNNEICDSVMLNHNIATIHISKEIKKFIGLLAEYDIVDVISKPADLSETLPHYYGGEAK